MEIHYCDLCDCPLKENDFYILGFINQKDNNYSTNYYQDSNNNIDKLAKTLKEICPKRKEIIDRIFELRVNNLNQLTQELLGIYELPSNNKRNKHEKK